MPEFFLKQLYPSLLGREPDQSGLEFWQQLLDSGQVTEAEVVQQFLDSAEFTALSEPIARLYYAILDRAPDTEGMSFWMQAYRNGKTLEEITEAFLNLPEYLEGQGERTDLEFIEALYRDVLDREPDGLGAQFWVMQLAQGESRANVILGFAQSPEFIESNASVIEYVLLHQALRGETPAQDVIAQALEIGVRIQIIENLLERVTRGQGEGSTPEPEVPPTPEPAPEPVPPADTTAPTITAFFVTSASTISVASTEAGRAGLYAGDALVSDGACHKFCVRGVT